MGNTTAQKAHEIHETNLAQIQKHLYIQAFIEYEELKNRKDTLSNGNAIKGTLVQKKQFRKKAGKTYCYIYHYLQVSEYKAGKRKVKKQYVPKAKLPQVKEALEKRGKEGTSSEVLQEKTAMLKEHEKQLRKYIRKGLLPDMETLEQEARQIYAAYKQGQNYRQQEVVSVQANPAYRIRTEAGELVMSKNECIVANMLYGRKILYFYEKPLQLKPRRDGTPVVFRPDFTVKVGGKEIYIEILGMMQKEEYATSWEYRLATYKINGIRLGENLVALEFPTLEQNQEIDCRKVSYVLDELMKNRIPQSVVSCGTTT